MKTSLNQTGTLIWEVCILITGLAFDSALGNILSNTALSTLPATGFVQPCGRPPNCKVTTGHHRQYYVTCLKETSNNTTPVMCLKRIPLLLAIGKFRVSSSSPEFRPGTACSTVFDWPNPANKPWPSCKGKKSKFKTEWILIYTSIFNALFRNHLPQKKSLSNQSGTGHKRCQTMNELLEAGPPTDTALVETSVFEACTVPEKHPATNWLPDCMKDTDCNSPRPRLMVLQLAKVFAPWKTAAPFFFVWPFLPFLQT